MTPRPYCPCPTAEMMMYRLPTSAAPQNCWVSRSLDPTLPLMFDFVHLQSLKHQLFSFKNKKEEQQKSLLTPQKWKNEAD